MKKVFSIIFVLILLLPTAVWFTGLEFNINVERIGLKPPRFDSGVLLKNDYYRSFDQYLNDSFSLRDPLVFVKRWLDYHLFNMTDTAGVHVGIHGWLYDRQSIVDVQKEACDEAAAIEQLALTLHAAERIIAASGRQFLFTVAPNKSTIYPEFLGFIPTDTSCHRSRYDLLLESFERHPLKGFVRLDNRLQSAKHNTAWLYDPTSTFWNALGAAVAAQAIGDKVVKNGDQHWILDPTQENPGKQIDLSRRMLGLLKQVEDSSAIQLTAADPSDRFNSIVYGDDYLKNLIPYLSQILGRIEVGETDTIPPRRHIENWQSADIILLQTAESHLGTIRLDIDKIYRTFEAETLLPVSYPIDLQTFVPQTNISLNIRAAGLEIKSVGNSSHFAVSSISGSDSHVLRLLKLTVEAPHLDTMTLQFETHPPLITRKALRKGLTELYLPLPFEKTLALSINPGNKAGVLMLHSAEILSFAELRETTEPQRFKNFLAKWPSDRNTVLTKLNAEALATEETPAPKLPRPNVDLHDSAEMSPSDEPVSALKAAFDEVFADQEIQFKKDLPGTSKNRSIRPALKIKAKKSKIDVPKELPFKKDDDRTAKAKTSPTAPQTIIKHSKNGSANEKDQTQVSSKVVPRIPTLPSITLADFAEGCIFQRKGTRADIVVSGSYNGTIAAIEARVVRSQTLTEVVPWTIIDPSPKNGIFVGQLAGVPQGGWYVLQVRSHLDHHVFDNGKHHWGVGVLIACLGQSNMNEWFHTGNNLKAQPLLRKFSGNGWSKLGTKGNAAIAFGNRVIERLGIPVGLLDFAVNGSGLRKEADYGTGYWADTTPGSIYNRFVSGVSSVGGVLEFVIWIQGEADAARGTVTQNEYVDALTYFIEDQVRSDITNGSDREHLPFLVVMMIKRPGGKDHPHQAIRNAQKQVVEQVADCYLAATTLDLKNHGRQHLKPQAYVAMGNRVAQTVLYIVGKEHYHRGPQVVSAKQVEDRMIEIIIQHNGGNDFNPLSGISGWEIIVNGTSVPIQEVYRHDAQTIRIVTVQPLIEHASIRYLHGAMPDVSHPVLDNSPLALPLEEYQSEIN